MREPRRRAATPRARARFSRLRALRNERKTRGGGPCRTLHIFDEPAEAIPLRIAKANGRIENLFGDLAHSIKERAAPCQNYSARELALPPALFDLVGDVHQDLFGARLKNVAEDLS